MKNKILIGITNKSSVLILMIFSLMALVFNTGCADDQTSFPSVDFDVDKSSIRIKDNEISSEFVTITITRLDSENIPTTFTIKFMLRNPESVYPVDAEGNKITEISTKALQGKNAKDILQFKVFGKKNGFEEAKAEIRIELLYNNTPLKNKHKTLDISIV